MPIVATVGVDLFDMAVLLDLQAPSQHDSREGQEHGRTIPLPEVTPTGPLENTPLFNHLVRGHQNFSRHRKAELFCGPEIEDQFKPGRRLNR